MKRKKRTLILISVLICLAVVAAVLLYSVPLGVLPVTIPDVPELLPAAQLLTAEAVAADRDECIRIVEETHPYFIVEADQTAYTAAKEQYRAATAAAMTVGEFEAATAEYLCFFGDGHTSIRWVEEEYLTLERTYSDGKTWLERDGEKTDIWLESIGGVSMENIYATIDRVFPAENEMAVEKNRNRRLDGRKLLTLAGGRSLITARSWFSPTARRKPTPLRPLPPPVRRMQAPSTAGIWMGMYSWWISTNATTMTS